MTLSADDLRESVSDYRNPHTTYTELELIRSWWAEHGIMNQFHAMLTASEIEKVTT